MIGRNNPLNIRYNPCNKWFGQSGQRQGFCNFRSLEYGLRAAVLILNNYRRDGVITYFDIISRWAPSSENATEHYILYVCAKCNVSRYLNPFESPFRISQLIYYMWCFEQGKSPTLSIDEIMSYVKKYW